MDLKVIWSTQATKDLRDICSYIARFDPEAANHIGLGILKHAATLSSFPFIGPTYPRGTRSSLREIVFRNFRIFYDVSESSHTVEIIHVRHGARDEPNFN